MKTRQMIITAALLFCLTTLVPSTLAESGGIPVGSYSTTVNLADIPPDFPPEVVEILVGTWVTQLTEDGSTIVRKNGELVAYGTYTTSKSYLVFRDKGGPLACTDAHGIATGVYSWTLENGELTLSPVLDRCYGRMFVLTLRPLQQS
jgi:hypothetical protein